MQSQDQWLNTSNKVLINIKIIKLQAWDEKFWKKLEDLRSVEKSWVSIFMYITGWNVSSLWLASTAASIATFILYISLNGQLIEPGKIFTAVATFSILQEPIRVFPEALMAITQALVSVQRLKFFLQSDELQDDAGEQQVYVPGLKQTRLLQCVWRMVASNGNWREHQVKVQAQPERRIHWSWLMKKRVQRDEWVQRSTGCISHKCMGLH